MLSNDTMRRVLQEHTADMRAQTFEGYYREAVRSNVVEVSRPRKAASKLGATA